MAGGETDDATERKSQRITMATIGAAHGVRGEVKLTVFADDPLTLRRYNPFEAPDGRVFKLLGIKVVGKAFVARFDGLDDRNEAETLRGTVLSVPRGRLPRPAEDEFYYVDLVGLDARLADGRWIGNVHAVHDFGAGDLLELTGPRPAMIPFTREAVPHVAIEDGYVVIDPPDGLLEDPGKTRRRKGDEDNPDDLAEAPPINKADEADGAV